MGGMSKAPVFSSEEKIKWAEDILVTVFRAALRALGRKFAWTPCTSSDVDGAVLASILSQLSRFGRPPEGGSRSERMQISPIDFMNQLPDLCPNDGPCLHIVLDNAHQLSGQLALGTLLRARELSSANVSIIVLSQTPWGSKPFYYSLPVPLVMYLQGYKREQIDRILKQVPQVQAMPDHSHEDFLSCVVGPLLRCTKSLRKLQKLVGWLAGKYWEPVLFCEVEPDDAATLGTRAWKHLSSAVHFLDGDVLDIEVRDSFENLDGSSNLDWCIGLDLTGISFMTKLLLLAAFICSKNRAVSDRLVFDPTYRSAKRQRNTPKKKQTAAPKVGPNAFPLERLLAVFRHLYRQMVAEDSGNARDANFQDMVNAHSGQVMIQLRSLMSMKLLSQSSGDLIEGGKYHCEVPEQLARKIANNLKVDLADYLHCD